MKSIELQKKLKILTNLWILTVITIYLSPFLSSLSIGILSTPGACQKVVALPLYKLPKGVDQGEDGQRQSLVDLGTVPQFDGQGSYCQDVWSTPGKHHQDVRYAKIHPVHSSTR